MGSLIFVAGARPNFMKIAPLLRALATRPSALTAEVVHTGQHYDFEMSGVFLEQLGIGKPDVQLEVGSGSHGEQTARIMIELERYLTRRSERPRGIVVVGDVNSTMAATLVAVKMGIPVAHVEAGLRSSDRTMPEEINRLVTDSIADLLLVSEPAGLDNLAREGCAANRIRYIGNVMIDSLVHQIAAARELAMPAHLGLQPADYALVTLHRPSNVDDPTRLAALTQFLHRLAERVPVVFPVHPRTNKQLEQLGLLAELTADPRVRLCPPLGYREFLGLMDSARLIISDSGGIQEETTYLGIPCLTLRSNTERPVTVTHGTNTLIGEQLDRAWSVIDDVLAGRYKRTMSIDGWDGQAANRAIDVLIEAWQ